MEFKNFLNKGIESLPQQLWFANPYIFATQGRISKIFQTLNYVKINKLSLKYQRFTPSGCKDIKIKKFEFDAKNQFLYPMLPLIKAQGFPQQNFSRYHCVLLIAGQTTEPKWHRLNKFKVFLHYFCFKVFLKHGIITC